jgi:hypothetical protein
MRRLQIAVACNWRTARSQRRGIQRDHSREQGPCVNRLLGFLVRTMPDGRASRGANRSGPRRACSCAEGRYRTLSRTCSAIQRPQHSQFRGVFARSTAISAGGPGRRRHHGELAYGRGLTDRFRLETIINHRSAAAESAALPQSARLTGTRMALTEPHRLSCRCQPFLRWGPGQRRRVFPAPRVADRHGHVNDCGVN